MSTNAIPDEMGPAVRGWIAPALQRALTVAYPMPLRETLLTGNEQPPPPFLIVGPDEG